MFELASADVTYNFGTIPNWLMSFAAVGMFVLSWRASRNAKKAAALAALAVSKIEEVRHETNSMRTVIEESKLQEGRQQVIDETAAAAADPK